MGASTNRYNHDVNQQGTSCEIFEIQKIYLLSVPGPAADGAGILTADSTARS